MDDFYKSMRSRNKRLLVWVVFLFGAFVASKAQYTSNDVVGDFEDNTSWVGGNKPNVNRINQAINIYGEITRNGDLDSKTLDVYGKLIITGSYTKNAWSGTTIHNGGEIIVYGDVGFNQKLTVEDGATLIVYGSLTTNWGGASSQIDGNVIVMGDFTSYTGANISSTGNLVIAGDLNANGWAINIDGDNTDNVYLIGEDSELNVTNPYSNRDLNNNGTGDSEDLQTNESGNTDLIDELVDLGLVDGADNPTNFTYSKLNGTSVELDWTLNADNDGVIVAYSNSTITWIPTKGTSYTNGDTPSTGVEIIYSGTNQSVPFTSLVSNGITYFKIWSVSSEVAYSSGVAQNIGSSSSTMFYEDFETPNYTWTKNSSRDNYWIVDEAESYRGDKSAYVSNDNGVSAAYSKDYGRNGSLDLICESPVTIKSEYLSAELKFYWKGQGEANCDYGTVLIGTDPTNMTALSTGQLQGSNSWVKGVISLDAYIGQIVYIGFRFTYDPFVGNDPGLCVDEISIVGSTVGAASNFTGTATSASNVDLTWSLNSNNDKVVVAYSPFGVLGAPVSGKDYSVGDYLSGGGEVIYVGTATQYSHAVSATSAVKYGIWSTNANSYSSGNFVSVNLPVSLPYTEDFENRGQIDEWSFGASDLNDWMLGAAEKYTGSNGVYISTDKGTTAGYDGTYKATADLSLSVDLKNYNSASLTFYYKCNGRIGRRSSDAYGEVLVNGDALSVNGDTWLYDVTDWTSATIDLSGYLGQIVTLSFRWNNIQDAVVDNPGFCMDDVSITGIIDDPASFKAENPNDTYNNLSWVQNSASDTVMVALAADGTFGALESGKIYKEGDVIDGGGTILYLNKEELTYKHEPLNYGTIYYYKAWSARRGIYSEGLTASANTPDKVTVLKESWGDDSDDTNVTWSTTNPRPSNYWLTGGSAVFSDSEASGSDATTGSVGHSAYITNDGTSAGYNIRTESTSFLYCTLDLTNMETCTLTFDWKCMGEVSDQVYDYGEVYVNDGSGDILISKSKEYVNSNSWQKASFDLGSYAKKSITLKFKWYNDSYVGGNPGFCIDNIEAGGIYTATSSILAGSNTEPTTISSIVNSSSDAVEVFDFTFKDRSGSLNTPTTTAIQQFVISKGSNNNISDWSDAIAGAVLYGPDMAATGLEGVVTSASITFTGKDMITLADASEESYQLRIWLKTDLDGAGIHDRDAFDFSLNSNDIVTGEGDDFEKNVSVSSGTIAIDVAATALSMNQQPSAYATVSLPLSQVPVIAGVDINGNIDADFTGSVTLSNSKSIGMSPTSATASSGLATFTGLTFSSTGTVNLTASYSGFTDLTSDNITITNYCIPNNTDNSTFYINTVLFEDINNTSGLDAGNYGDYLNLVTEVERDEKYSINVGLYNNIYGKTGYLYTWVDWDQSETFDTDELVQLGSVTKNGSIQSLTGFISVPSDAVSGTTRMRVLFTTKNGSDACGDGNIAETEDCSITITDQGWLGGSTDWGDKENWSTGIVPDASTDVSIPEHPSIGTNYPVVSGTAEMNDLDIDNNATVTITAGSIVTINGNLTGRDNGLIVENSNASPSSLIVYGTASPQVNIKWALDKLTYWYIGHSVTGVTMSEYNASFASPNNYFLYEFATPVWSDITKSGTYLFDDPLKGYQLIVKDAGSFLSYSGLLNLRDYTKSGMAAQWYLIANPYSSYLDLGGADFGSFLKSVWIRTDLGAGERGFATYNLETQVGQNGGERNVAPGQSVWLRTHTANDAITIPAVARVHATGNLKANSIENDVLRMTLQSDYAKDEAVVVARDFGLETMSAYDSEKKLASGKVANFYSLKDGEKAAINTLPAINQKRVVPLGYQVSKDGMSDFTLKVNNLNYFVPEVSVYLVDTYLDKTINLREQQKYTFTPQTTQADDRFELVFDVEQVFDSGVSTDISNPDISELGIDIFAIDQVGYIQFKDEVIQTNGVAELYSTSGVLIKQVQINKSLTEISLPKANSVYIVKVVMGSVHYTKKIESL